MAEKPNLGCGHLKIHGYREGSGVAPWVDLGARGGTKNDQKTGSKKDAEKVGPKALSGAPWGVPGSPGSPNMPKMGTKRGPK